ncbi:hypothetical protein ES703_84862 [subsurface metagenome]
MSGLTFKLSFSLTVSPLNVTTEPGEVVQESKLESPFSITVGAAVKDQIVPGQYTIVTALESLVFISNMDVSIASSEDSHVSVKDHAIAPA